MLNVVGSEVLVASSSGSVSALSTDSGRLLWEQDLGTPLVSGVGGDGKTAAVVADGGELIAFSSEKVLWRHRLGAISLTTPLVAGARVFSLSADRTVTAFDALSGQRLWQQQRPVDSLVLGQNGLLLAVGDTLVVGLGGRLVGLNALTGATVWDVSIAVSRGTNEVERLVDLVAGVSRLNGNICLRAFQAAVACVDAAKGTLVWSKTAAGVSGMAGDSDYVYGTESDGTLFVWRRDSGERAWSSAALQWRSLSAPAVSGETVVVGDSTGLLHFLSRADGSPLDRASTDGSGIVGAPVFVGKTLIAVTQKGGVFAFRPE